MYGLKPVPFGAKGSAHCLKMMASVWVLLWLDFYRAFQVDVLAVMGNGDFLAFGQIMSNDFGVGPVEGPAVFDCHECVFTRDDALQDEAPVGVALIATEHLAIGPGIGWDEQDHDSGCGFAIALRKAVHRSAAFDERGGHGNRSGADFQQMAVGSRAGCRHLCGGYSRFVGVCEDFIGPGAEAIDVKAAVHADMVLVALPSRCRGERDAQTWRQFFAADHGDLSCNRSERFGSRRIDDLVIRG